MQNKKKYILISLVELTGDDPTSIIHENIEGSVDKGLNYPDRWLKKDLRLSLFDYQNDWLETKLSNESSNLSEKIAKNIQNKEFICSTVGNIYGNDNDIIVCGVTLRSGQGYIFSLQNTGNQWQYELLTEMDNPEVNYIRSIATGDLNNDKIDEIAFTTKPNGQIYVVEKQGNKFIPILIEKQKYGAGTTNARELIITDFTNNKEPEIIAAISYSYAGSTQYNSAATKWGKTKGCVSSFKKVGVNWESKIIDDFNNETHTRMLTSGDLLGLGSKQLISNSVGVYDENEFKINPQTSLNIYFTENNNTNKQIIDYPELAIKSRGMAIGDIDNDKQMELIVGTRTLDIDGYRKTFLLCYKYNTNTKEWNKSIIDTSGEIGFHTVAVIDYDNDGQDEIIASDDQKGLIKAYKLVNNTWQVQVIKDFGHRIFVSSIDSILV
jgi:hypothetical protein